MSDSTRAAFAEVMRAIEDVTPPPPDLQSPVQRTASNPLVVAVLAFVAVLIVGTVSLTLTRTDTGPDVSGSQPSVTEPPTATTVPSQPTATTVAPTVTVPVAEVWTIEDSLALLTEAEWERVRIEADVDRNRPEVLGEDYNARTLKWHEDDLFSFTGDRLLVDPGAGTRVPLERGGLLPIFGSTLLDGGTVDPESIIGNGRPLFVMIWRPGPWDVDGRNQTTHLNLDAFQQAYERWGDKIGFIGVIWNEPIVEWETEEFEPAEILNFGRQVVDKNGYTFPNVIGRVNLPQVPEPWSPMWLLTGADGRVTGGFFAHGAVRVAETALDSLPVDHLLTRLVIPIDELSDTLNERYLWTPEKFGDVPGKEPLPGRCGSSVESPPGCNG